MLAFSTELGRKMVDGRAARAEGGLVELRPLSPTEWEVLTAWLDHDVAGAIELRTQVNSDLRVFGSCDCGCGSLGFARPVDDTTGGGVSMFPIDAEIIDGNGQMIGGMVLLVREGRLHDIDIHTYEEAQPFPTLACVRWHRRT
jgi:hypothetical protein